MLESVYEYSVGKVKVFVGIDRDDRSYKEYLQLMNDYSFLYPFFGDRTSLSDWTNILADAAMMAYGVDGTYLVSMGDDHEIKSDLWNLKLMDAIRALDGPGFAYGDDLINGSGLCTSWMASAEIVKKQYWMMLPECKHMYVDNAIMELGQAANRMAYVPSVTIEHHHPVIQKSEIDQTYLDGSASMETDLQAFRDWHTGPRFNKEVERISGMKW